MYRSLYYSLYYSLFIIMIIINSYCKNESFIYTDSSNLIELNKIGEINKFALNGGNKFFLNIEDIEIDNKNYLYVVDSGWNSIFKFNENGICVGSFGRAGQGPGEFLAKPGSSGLRLSFGNNGLIYVTDYGNRRISVFNENFKFIKNHILPESFFDYPAVDSYGNIYLLSLKKDFIIDKWDKDFNLKKSFLSSAEHFSYPVIEDPNKQYKSIHKRKVMKFITKENHLIVFSNISLSAFIFNENNLGSSPD